MCESIKLGLCWCMVSLYSFALVLLYELTFSNLLLLLNIAVFVFFCDQIVDFDRARDRLSLVENDLIVAIELLRFY